MNARQEELCEKTQNLATLLKESKEYQEYVRAKENLRNQEDLVVLLSEFRRKQLNLQVANMTGQDIEEDVETIEKLKGYVDIFFFFL